MRLFKCTGAILVSVVVAACASPADQTYRMFGKNAALREVAGPVIASGTNGWGQHYIVVKDEATGLRIYVQSDVQACVAGKSFKGNGHLTRAMEKDYDATFHFHLSEPECG